MPLNQTKIFPKSVSLKANVIVRLEFELTNFWATVQHVSNYTTGTSNRTMYKKIFGNNHANKKYI